MRHSEDEDGQRVLDLLAQILHQEPSSECLGT